MKDTLDASNVQEFRGVLKRFMDGSFVRFAFYKGSEGNDNRHGAPGRFTTRDNDVRVHRSVVVHKFPAPPSPCTPYAHAYVRLCPCILINTLLTPRPRHINHETMENAVGGGPTGVDLSIPLSCIPPPPSPVYPRCVPRTPSVATMGHISLSLSPIPTPVCAPSLLEKFPPVFIAKFHERGQDCIAPRGFRSRNRPLLTGGGVGSLDFAVIPRDLAAILGGRGNLDREG